tara:strand:- start:89 stop:466 length:378 start_codon:yes stop_codon:yes gene_type:complete
MFFEIIKWAIISLILIILVHYLFNFFKENLTIPKTKDLVTKPLEKYKTMETIISNNSYVSNFKQNENKNESKQNNSSNNTTLINDLNIENVIPSTNEISNLNFNNLDSSNMKSELKSFFSQLNDI